MHRLLLLVPLVLLFAASAFAGSGSQSGGKNKMELLTHYGAWKCVANLGEELGIAFSALYTFIPAPENSAFYHQISFMDYLEVVRYESAESGYAEIDQAGNLLLTPRNAQLRSAGIIKSAYNSLDQAFIDQIESELPESKLNYRQSLSKHVGTPLTMRIDKLTTTEFAFTRGVESRPSEVFYCGHLKAEELWEEFGWIDGQQQK